MKRLGIKPVTETDIDADLPVVRDDQGREANADSCEGSGISQDSPMGDLIDLSWDGSGPNQDRAARNITVSKGNSTVNELSCNDEGLVDRRETPVFKLGNVRGVKGMRALFPTFH